MAKGGKGERRMVFDVRGRRRHVIRVVYAILAILMGTSLFLVVGPFNLGEVINTGGAQSATEALEDQAERIEGRLRSDPNDEQLLLALTRARLNVGRTLLETNPQTGLPVVTSEARGQYLKAVEAWNRYLEEAKPPNPAAAALVAQTYFSLAEASLSFEEVDENVEKAAETQDLAVSGRPNVGSLTTLAIYKYFAGDFGAGDKARRQAKKLAQTKAEVKTIDRQLGPYRTRAKRFVQESEKFAKQQAGKGKESLENALGGTSFGAGATFGE
jgi:tetratricopeptide (TPR) repeat protein